MKIKKNKLTFSRSLGHFILQHVEVGDVGLVMFGVVQLENNHCGVRTRLASRSALYLHDLGRDDGLQGVVVVGKIRQRVGEPAEYQQHI